MSPAKPPSPSSPQLPATLPWQRRYARLLRHARRRVRRQQRRLLQLELDGIVAVTLHVRARQLTLPVEVATGLQLAGELWEVLRQRRHYLREQRRQLRETIADNAPHPLPPPAEAAP